MIRAIRVGILMGSVLLACGDGGNAEMAVAHAARQQFHERLQTERYSEIYSDADGELRQRETESKFVSYLMTARTQLSGKRAERETHVGVVLEGELATVVLNYDVDVGDRTLAEESWWRVRRQNATLLAYRLQPK